MKRVTKITTLLFLLVMTTSCFFNGFGIQGNGNVVSDDRNISSNFSGIEVSQGIQVRISQGNETKLTVEADENIIDLLITEIDGDILKIYFEKNVNRATRNIYLTVEKLNSIRTTSGAHVKNDGVFKTKTLSLDSSSGSHILLDLNVSEVTASASSGADIELSGSSDEFRGDASSGSHIDADELNSKIATADVSSGANINVYASQELNAKASSGGDIDYYGSPEVVNKSKSSGGSISKH
ncbi:MAG: hypothetical protein ACJAV9_000586 [Urechidicola sp.]|jgi:hypothetical protein